MFKAQKCNAPNARVKMYLKMDIKTENSAIDLSNAIASVSKPIVSLEIPRMPNKFA